LLITPSLYLLEFTSGITRTGYSAIIPVFWNLLEAFPSLLNQPLSVFWNLLEAFFA
jgi:hypothetical protein